MSSGLPSPDAQPADSAAQEAPPQTDPPVASAASEDVSPQDQPVELAPEPKAAPETSPAAEVTEEPPQAEMPAPATTPPAEAPTAERPRVKLDPVKDPSQLRAVGSVDAVEQPTLVPAGGDAPKPMPSVPSGPVEIPDLDDLDSDIEAQVNAALQSEQPAAAPPAPVVDSETGETVPSVDDTGLPVEGAKLKATVQSIHEDSVFLDVGARISAVVALRQFSGKPPAVGDVIDVVVEGTDDDESLIQTNLPRGTRRVSGNWDDLAQGQVVECMVNKTNKGGLEVTVSNLRGFLPASQIEMGYVADMAVYVGQKLRVQVMEVNPRKRNLVVSRRALLQAEREAEAEGFWQAVSEGDVCSGTVKTLKDYGAFIDIGPVDGFLHIGEISWSRVGHPKEVLTEGQQIEVKILKVDHEKKRIGLGMRQLSQNPWMLATEKYAAGRVISGKVSRIADFGAFVELEPGIEGLVHVSELAWRRVRSVAEVLSVGQQEEFKVLEVDPNRKRISLSLKQTQDKPAAPVREDRPEPQASPAPTSRPSPKNLKGGTGSSGSGGLFGNPSDFS